jgi:tetratricopeptide (TPR) repeat protein
MDKITRKRIKIVLISFCIVIILLGYIFYASMVYQNANQSYNIGYGSEDKAQIMNSINQLNSALKVIPWSKNLRSWKYMLYFKNGDYDKALKFAKARKDNKFISIIYESIGKPDSAKLYYRKQIDFEIKELKKQKDNYSKLTIQRQIALLYTFLGEKEVAKKYMTDLSVADQANREYLQHFDFYIENYKSGGLNDYYFGKTICMRNDSINNRFTLDSLMTVDRFVYESYSSTKFDKDKEVAIYKFREIYKTKAQKLGFKESSCEGTIFKVD